MRSGASCLQNGATRGVVSRTCGRTPPERVGDDRADGWSGEFGPE